MDDTDRKIIALLTADSRRALADIGGVVGLSPSSVNERIRRLVASGAIRRFTVEASADMLDQGTLVFLWLALREGADEDAFRQFTADYPRIAECHHVTGAWSYLIKLQIGGIGEIETILAELKTKRFLGRSETVIALSSPVAGAFVPKV